jgi:tRNA-2-methylthio-N6-dimethylallyladenosine synthase
MKSKQKYHIITIGCQMNKSDSERIAAYLEGLGYIKAKDRGQADLVVLTTCGVRQSAENRVYGLIPAIKKENPGTKIILTGCLSERSDVIKKLKDKVDIWLPIKSLPTLATQLHVAGPRTGDDYLDIKPKYENKISGFIPIGNGCDNFCAYCVVPYARGREKYRNFDNILKEAEYLIQQGFKELNLIAQNVNSYHCPESGKKFPELLQAVNDLPGDFWLRFSSNHPKDITDELIATMKNCDKLCEHVHLPVQAGNNEVLKNMNRNYTVEHYLELIKKIRQAVPGIAITTDVIVGFPGETEEQFRNTLELFRKVKFAMAYTAQYSPRPGTTAFKMKDNVNQADKKQREEELTTVLRQTALENNQKYLNKTVEVLVDGRNRKGEWRGRTRANKNVEIQKESNINLLGKIIKTKIVAVKDFGMKGKAIIGPKI